MPIYRAEEELLCWIKRLSAKKEKDLFPQMVIDEWMVCAHDQFPLTVEQRVAFGKILTSGFGILPGPAGVGKSLVMKTAALALSRTYPNEIVPYPPTVPRRSAVILGR